MTEVLFRTVGGEDLNANQLTQCWLNKSNCSIELFSVGHAHASTVIKSQRQETVEALSEKWTQVSHVFRLVCC